MPEWKVEMKEGEKGNIFQGEMMEDWEHGKIIIVHELEDERLRTMKKKKEKTINW